MTQSLRLFHFSDIHFGLEDKGAIDWAAQCVAREQPDAVIITGDITMRARHREYDAAARWIGALPAPTMVSIGNHDMPYFNPVERIFAPYRRFRRLQRQVEAHPDLGNLAIVPLKTTMGVQWRANWSRGWVSQSALETTLAAIDALPGDAQVIVAAHHPLREVGSTGHAYTRHGGRALEELARRGVVAVISGHIHDAFDLMEDTPAGPVRMIGAGTLSLRLRSSPPGFNALSLSEGALQVTVRTYPGARQAV